MENTEVMHSDATILSTIIANNYKKKLGEKEKIKFSQMYHGIFGDTKIVNILGDCLVDDDQKQTIYRFICCNGLTKKARYLLQENGRHAFYSTNISDKAFEGILKNYDDNNWLEEYDVEKQFDVSNARKMPIIFNYLKKDGSAVTINKECAKAIKSKLEENGIYPSRCVVEGAFRHFAYDTLDDYIKEISDADEKKEPHMTAVTSALIKLIEQKPIILDTTDKIRFAQAYHHEVGDISIMDILENNIDNKEVRGQIVKFMTVNKMSKPAPNYLAKDITSNNFGLSYVKNGINSKSLPLFKFEYNPQNWLEQYDEDMQFKDTPINHHVRRSILCKDKSQFVIDKETARKIKLSLIELDIFPAVCIMGEAFKQIGNKTFSEFTSDVKSLTLKGGRN